MDANNLYGYAMSDPLPICNFKWLSEDEILDYDLKRLGHNQQLGYILDVDLSYPIELHTSYNSYPLAPELYQSLFPKKMKESSEPFSYKSTAKLILNLKDKTNYVLHGKSLSLYLSLEMKVSCINRVLQVIQRPWLKPFMRNAKNSFEKDLFTLFNTAIFGKTLENVRKRQRIALVATKEKLENSQPLRLSKFGSNSYGNNCDTESPCLRRSF